MLFQSNYTSFTAPFFNVKNGNTVFIDLSKVPDNVKTIQKNVFFFLRDICVSEENKVFNVELSVEGMNLLDIIRFYINSNGDTHIIGFLMLESAEKEVGAITVKTKTFLQKKAAELIMNAFSTQTQKIIHVE